MKDILKYKKEIVTVLRVLILNFVFIFLLEERYISHLTSSGFKDIYFWFVYSVALAVIINLLVDIVFWFWCLSLVILAPMYLLSIIFSLNIVENYTTSVAMMIAVDAIFGIGFNIIRFILKKIMAFIKCKTKKDKNQKE